MDPSCFTRDELVLIEGTLMGLPVHKRAEDLGLRANDVRIKVTRMIEQIDHAPTSREK